jgi:hypothetical protein
VSEFLEVLNRAVQMAAAANIGLLLDHGISHRVSRTDFGALKVRHQFHKASWGSNDLFGKINADLSLCRRLPLQPAAFPLSQDDTIIASPITKKAGRPEARIQVAQVKLRYCALVRLGRSTSCQAKSPFGGQCATKTGWIGQMEVWAKA